MIMTKSETLGELPKFMQGDMQGADAVAKMAPTDLLHAELPRAFNLFKKKLRSAIK